MTTQFFWKLPADGDGRALNPRQWARGDHGNVRSLHGSFARTGVAGTELTYYDQLLQVARAAELTGFDGIHIPQAPAGEEPLVVAGSVVREVRRLTLLPSVPPLLAPVYAAKIATSFQRLSGNRLALELATLPDEAAPWHGRHWSQAEQVERIGEFLDVLKGFWSEPGFSYQGRYYEVDKGGFAGPLAGHRLPLIHLSGDSPEALALSARHADVHILALAPIEEIRARIAALRALAAGHGRAPAIAIRADIIARHTDEEAAAHAHWQWEAAGLDAASFVPPAAGDLLWPGFERLRAGAGAGLVGGHDALAERLADYAEAGVERFLLSANPHLEEAYRVGEHLLPITRARIAARIAAAAAA